MDKRDLLKKYLFISISSLYIIFSFYILHASNSNDLDHSVVVEDVVSDRLLHNIPGVSEILFSYENDLQDRLVNLIERETKKIQIASFRFTDKRICQAILDAARRGVKIEIISDRGCIGSVYSKVLVFLKYGFPIYVFPSLEKDLRNTSVPLMHNKIIIFHGLKLVWTGSYNFTVSACKKNEENVVILKNVHSIYTNYFESLKSRSTQL